VTLEEQLESFYVDAGLTDEATRGDLAPEGDVERWLTQARLKIGPGARKIATVTWASEDTTIALPADCQSVSRIVADSGSVVPAYDEWGQVLALRSPAQSDGSATLFYCGYYEPATDSSSVRSGDPSQDAAALACIEYALSRFFRKLAGSRVDYRRYSTITGQSGVDAQDLRDLSDDYLANFESAKADLAVEQGAPTSYYGD
jgi:hypothetical protein